MNYENYRRTTVKSVLIILLLAMEGPAVAQFDLTGKGGNQEHATWKITLKSANLAPGDMERSSLPTKP